MRGRETNELSKFLFSSSGYSNKEADKNEYRDNENYEDIDLCQANFLDRDSSEHTDNLQFRHYHGHSEYMNQNNSQNSVMLNSIGHGDDSRDEINQRQNIQRILDRKKEEEIAMNEALDMELKEIRNELQSSQFEIKKLKDELRVERGKVAKKQQQIRQHQLAEEQLQRQINKFKEEKRELLRSIQNKDECFLQLQGQLGKFFNQIGQKNEQIEEMRMKNTQLTREIDKLNQNLSIYVEPDRKLMDFKGYGYQQYESPLNSKKNSNSDKIEKELQKLKKDKTALEIQLNALKEKLQDRENRSRMLEDENRKKLSLKDRKIQQIEQNNAQLKSQLLKKTSLFDGNLEKTNSSLNAKLKEINNLNEKIGEYQKRIKLHFEESKKKDEKIRDLTMQILQKNKAINQKNKQLEDMKIKQEFDQHLVTEKDEQIQLLTEEKKELIQQLDAERLDKRDKQDKIDKAEKLKKQRQQQKQKKQFEALKKNCENLEKEKEQLSNSLKDCKRKLEQATKQLKSSKLSYSELETTIKSKEAQYKQKMQKTLKELNQYKKKAEMIQQFKNKIIILENRLKQNESIMKQSCDLSQSSNLLDKIDALESKLFERDQQIKSLKGKLKTSNQSSFEQDQDYQYLVMELAQKDKLIEKLEQQLQEKDDVIDQLNRDLNFKDNTLDFTHKILVTYEKEKIQLEQEKKMLQEVIEESRYNGNKSDKRYYEDQIQTLRNRQFQLQKKLRDQQETQRQRQYDNRQLKMQVRQYKEALLTRQKKMTPQTMSQEETVTFLLKTIKKVNRSADMLRLLAKNRELKDLIIRMSQELRSSQQSRQ